MQGGMLESAMMMIESSKIGWQWMPDDNTSNSIQAWLGFVPLLTTELRRFPWISTGWTKFDCFPKAIDLVDLAKLWAGPFNPKADAAAAKMVIKAREEATFMVVESATVQEALSRRWFDVPMGSWREPLLWVEKIVVKIGLLRFEKNSCILCRMIGGNEWCHFNYYCINWSIALRKVWW